MINKINAIFWDFDGTLVDSRLKNLHVTQSILEQISSGKAGSISVLQSVENYDRALRRAVNWRTFYHNQLGLNEQQIDQAGKMWTEYQLQNSTPTPLFDGIHQVIKRFRNIPQGIISQNSRVGITNILEVAGISEYFDVIIGYEEVGLNLQKPDPRGMLLGIEKMGLKSGGSILFIGDHETDVIFVNNTNGLMKINNTGYRITSIAALYGYDKEPQLWKYHPDHSAYEVHELIPLINKINSEL